jgi:predicted secreted protein
VNALMERGVGIIQMPCPELELFSLDRRNLSIRKELAKDSGRAACRAIARKLAWTIKEYRGCGIRVLGIIGKDGSPTCGVNQTWDTGVVPGMGVFVEELTNELRDQGLSLPITHPRQGLRGCYRGRR